MDEARAPGRREQNKNAKLLRIREAAQQVFAEKGFEAATMQEIARKARVATGTLFLYAENKRDIVFLATMPLVEEAIARGRAEPDDLPFPEQCARLFRHHYRVHHANPAVARVVLGELTFFTGRQAHRHAELLNALRAELERRVTLMHDRGSLRTDVEPRVVTQLIFYLFQGEVRRWVSDGARNVEAGLAALARLIGLAWQGVAGSAVVGRAGDAPSPSQGATRPASHGRTKL